MTPTSLHAVNEDAALDRIAQQADLVMLATLAASALAALAIGASFNTLGLALGAGAGLLALGAAAWALGRGSGWSQSVLVFANVAMVALHIQLGRGTIEFHFGVFVLLGVLLVYRDWRPIVLAAGLFAVHHLGFDRLQALNYGVYCTPEANFLKTAMHALYVVVQTAVEIVLALRLQHAAVETAQLSALVRAIDRGDVLCLDVATVSATAPTAKLLKSALDKLRVAMVEVRGASLSIESASSEIAQGNQNLSQRTEEQASNLQQAAAAMVQLTTTVQNTAATAQQANQLAGDASRAAEDGGEVVGQVVATMSGISQSSRRIADIIGTIDGIAFQTNILALNAAVEAARAGEQGRGFSVVAAEVRLLAQRSAAAAREIKTLITDSVARVDDGSRQVAAAGQRMAHIVDQARQVSSLISEISSATSEQTGGIGQVNNAVSQVDENTQRNAALVEQSAAAADSLKHQAVQLNAVVGRFALGAGAAA